MFKNWRILNLKVYQEGPLLYLTYFLHKSLIRNIDIYYIIYLYVPPYLEVKGSINSHQHNNKKIYEYKNILDNNFNIMT